MGEVMEVDRQARRAAIFAGLHRSGAPLLLANAWDVASAVTIVLGSAVAQAAYAVAARATRELLVNGTYDSTADGIPYDKINEAVRDALVM
jgi:hypothetical protein